MATRYRCSACGNVTRFDVVAARRTRAYFHYSVGGELTVEDEQLLEETVELVSCRWCGASGPQIEELEIGALDSTLDSTLDDVPVAGASDA